MADVHSLSIIALRTLSLRRIDYRCHVAYYCFTDLHTMSLVTSYLLRGAHQDKKRSPVTARRVFQNMVTAVLHSP